MLVRTRLCLAQWLGSHYRLQVRSRPMPPIAVEELTLHQPQVCCRPLWSLRAPVSIETRQTETRNHHVRRVWAIRPLVLNGTVRAAPERSFKLALAEHPNAAYVLEKMLVANVAVSLLDYFRVAYAVDEGKTERSDDRSLRRLSWIENGETARTLLWPAALSPAPARPHRIGMATIFAAVAPDEASLRWLRQVGGEWQVVLAVHDSEGVQRASIWRDDRGNLFLPFDPDHAIELLLTEQYRAGGRAAAGAARRSAAHVYYRVRPALPRKLQVAARRALSRAQARRGFPAWPIEPSLHDLYDLLLGLVADLAQRPLPYIAPWPAPFTWALVLTHDVETRDGYDHLDQLRNIEEDLDLRSTWNFVARRYDVDDAVVHSLTSAGHEVGVHGLYHDGRDLESRAVLKARLPEMEANARKWGAVGFRSPALRRSIDLMPLLRFDYDSSYPDTDPYGPDGGGCCSWLPYMIDELVELPVTVPQDHTLFEILHRRDACAWREKTEYLRGRGGMALVLTHPDYMMGPEALRAYHEFLRSFASDPSGWKALSRDVSAWWRRRRSSRPVLEQGRWCIEGEAAGEGAVAFVEPGGHLRS
jgi:peptidoglycan/xylan/chitin deacetylase (PgdA/CDA1 family)